MPLAPETRLGPYEILAPIGKGGMGEVYRAKDTKLDREVAIKVLPAVVAQDRERLARFEREAKVLASLNHPNIAQIYGLEESGDTRALVMELVHGDTLSEFIKRVAAAKVAPAPRPERIRDIRSGDRIYQGSLETALNYAKQIAEALEAAHEKGITHRDLKPANIMITPEGVVKVLDFGLASVGPAPTPDMSQNSPTMTMAATQAGMIMGTAAYMSPEQAAGKPVDKRSDIWSFGVVLWEMLTGKRLFDGETISHTLADVLRAPIDFSQVTAPAPIAELLKRCLDRNFKTRLQAIGEARIAIENYLADPSSSGPQAGGGAHPAWGPDLPKRSKWPWAVAALLAVIAAGGWFAYYRATRPAELKPLVRLDVDLGPDVSLGSVRGPDVIISPDGTRLVYASKGKLFSRKLDQSRTIELAGTDGAYAPFFSPDGEWVAFFDASKLKKVPVEGGAQVALCDAFLGYGGSWGDDGNIIASLSNGGALTRVASTGGACTPATELAPGDVAHRWPQILPGGKAVLFTSAGPSIDIVSLQNRQRKTLVRRGTFGRYLATSRRAGHLVYVNDGTLFAVAFDLDALEVQGPPVPILERVAYSQEFGDAHLDVSQVGTLLYGSGGAAGGLVTVQWLDSRGMAQPLLAKPGRYLRPRLSPDGRRLALEISDGSTPSIWIYEWQRDTMTRLTTVDAGLFPAPVWSPDGRYIAFQGKGGIFWTRADGAGTPQALTRSTNLQMPLSFASDGRRLSFQEQAHSGFDLWTAPLETDPTGLRSGKPEGFLQTSFDERHLAFSPDGRWVAYTSNESGSYQVYVRSFPDRGGKWQVSNDGGAYPVWSRNGRELFFRAANNRIMVVAYTVKGDSISAERPRVWSEKQLADFGIVRVASYDLAPDGRIAALMPAETPEAQQAQNHVIFLENFFDELRRKVPPGK